jgi:omega-6 fatty acid desaturase (delta-12 desaturase)|eukprot:CAMPEP_0206177874 /NCGR_PEP_ID=MMETSP1474-20131121/62544_1 /ASSEMBLY_ACC=CAM_ASM_001110 /TAXON_ID=97495 /ORGANISM="Imantonia sp., Strain RCC918" /LENGTH=383 /DNA_ID=CAMNT_0053589955 /DNA_START=50 /DNA_END=1201 /DNA_ORIENTATION=-
MGGGGSAAPAKERGYLAATLPQPDDKITKRSLRECIPPEYFKRSYAISLGHMAWDCFIVVFSWWLALQASAALPWFCSPAVWGFYWWYQGITCTGLWVIAHECGHGGFTDSRLVNDVCGWLIHSSLLTPYFSWAITHAKHHHYTNHMTMGETWVPSTANPEKKSVKYAKTHLGTIERVVKIAVMGWYVYLFVNATGARQNRGQSHFNPAARALFKPKDRPYVIASNIGMLLGLAVVLLSVKHYGLWVVFRNYLMPQTITNFYLTSITFMQHTHPDVPHFDGEDWTWLRGALSTIDRTMGPFIDAKLHHICDSHVVHHIFSDMPFYGAKAATPYVKEHLGIYYKSVLDSKALGSPYLGWLRDYYVAQKETVTVQKGENGWLWFK